MRKFFDNVLIFSVISLIITVIPLSGQGMNMDYPSLEIMPGMLKLDVGDSVELELVYRSDRHERNDTSGVWSVTPDSIASIDSSGVLVALSPGECCITAVLDTLTAVLCAEVKAPEEEEDPEEAGEGGLVIIPGDTVLFIGDSIGYKAALPDSNGTAMLVSDLTWSLHGMPVGSIADSTGLFTASASGYAIIKAQNDSLCGTALVIVGGTANDSSRNAILITRSSPNPMGYSVMDSLSEGGMWTIGGLPYPLNVLNGGAIYFPYGSLHEDIRLHISLPWFTRVGPSGMEYGRKDIVAAMDLQIFIGDSLVEESYYFDTPLVTGLIFKRGLLRNLGIEPEDLALYFAMELDDSVAFDPDGISGTYVDSSGNRIFAHVEHFSSLAIAEKSNITENVPNANNQAGTYILHGNYPNPFNPNTTISYSIPEAAAVTISIYNIQGRLIQSWNTDAKAAGTYQLLWNGRNQSLQPVSSGVYFVRMSSGDLNLTEKMLLLK